jgi:multidrug resistance efflux pump
MEALNNYNFTGFNFALWFFRILLLIIITMIVLIFVLKINETVAIRQGEIVAANPQSDYKAPFEAEIVKIKVKEGQPVQAGDTLLVMRNLEFADQYAKTKAEISYIQKKIQSISVLQDAIQKKRGAIDQVGAITSKKYQLDINRTVNDMKIMDEQYNYQKQRLSSAREKYIGDSILYKKDMLSKYEYNNTKDATIALQEDLATLRSERQKQLSEKNLAYNSFTREQNNLLLNKVQLEENAQSLIQAKNEYESQLIQANSTLKKLENELNKQNIIAAGAGIVNFLFNTKQSSNLISKGDLLISIAPQSVSYYAKVTVPERDMPYVRRGLNARLKLDAYQKFQKGLINGKVSYVAERKENDQFYALVQLPAIDKFELKSGYSIYGEIIIERLPLYKYFIKKIFKRFDQA